MLDMLPTAIVIDTNYLIHRLIFLIKLVEILPEGVKVCIPRVVLSELDGLKNRPSTQDKARAASNFILECLSINSSHIIVQRAEDILALQATSDDEILDYCKFLKANETPNVFILSNDRNLCIKSHLEDIIPFPEFNGPPTEFLNKLVADEVDHTFTAPKSTNRNLDYSKSDYIHMEIDSDDGISSTIGHEAYPLFILLLEINDFLVSSLSLCIQKLVQTSQIVSPEKFPVTVEELFQIIITNKLEITIEPSTYRLAKDITRSVRVNRPILTIGDLKRFLETVFDLILRLLDKSGLQSNKETVKLRLNTLFMKLSRAS